MATPYHAGTLGSYNRSSNVPRLGTQAIPCRTVGLVESASLIRVASGTSEKVVPKLMQYGDVPTACKTAEKSIAADPLERYLQATPNDHKDTRRYRKGAQILFRLQFYRGIFERSAWTVNHGLSVMIFTEPERKRGHLGKILGPFYESLVRGIRGLYLSEEQKKRSKELALKMEIAILETIGHKVSQMIEVGSIGTTPECQGRGYASALVRVATDVADARGVATWLGSSNVINRDFYTYLGFQIVATIYVGTDNPSWKSPPIPVDIMVREPKSANEKTINLEAMNLV